MEEEQVTVADDEGRVREHHERVTVNNKPVTLPSHFHCPDVGTGRPAVDEPRSAGVPIARRTWKQRRCRVGPPAQTGNYARVSRSQAAGKMAGSVSMSHPVAMMSRRVRGQG
jgi:hypothetical protein